MENGGPDNLCAPVGDDEESLRRLRRQAKALGCLCAINRIGEIPGLPADELFRHAVELIPAAWQYPDIARARIRVGEREYKTVGFKPTDWCQTEEISVGGQRVGLVELCYLAERPPLDEGPFLREERGLIQAIAERLSKACERRRIEEELGFTTKITKILNSLLKLTLSDLPLKAQLAQALDMVFSAPFMPLKAKGGIFLADSDQRKLVLFATRRLPRKLTETCANVPFGKCLCGRAAARRQIIFAPHLDMRHENKYRGITDHGHYVVPIVSGAKKSRVLGVMVLYVRAGHSREVSEERFLQAVADTLANVVELRQAEEALAVSEERYRTLAESASDVIFVVDREGRLRYVNSAGARPFGVQAAELIGKRLSELFPPTLAAEMHRGIKTVLDSRRPLRSEDIFSLFGREVWLDTLLAPLHGDNRDLIMGISRDITERKEMERALSRSEERFRIIVESTADCICRLDSRGNFLFLNSAGLAIHGADSIDALKGHNYADIAAPVDRPKVAKALAAAEEGRTTTLDFECPTASGNVWLESTITPQRDEGGALVSLIVISTDITERKRMEEELRYLSTHDALTALYSYGEFYERLRSEVERSRRTRDKFSLLMLDIDRFKQVNDQFGHLVGDQVLRKSARIFEQGVRSMDTVARYGGEEFIILLPGASLAVGLRTGERLRRAIAAAEFDIGSGRAVAIRVSVGVAAFSSIDITPNEMVEQVDQALYEAKGAGRNRVCRYGCGCAREVGRAA